MAATEVFTMPDDDPGKTFEKHDATAENLSQRNVEEPSGCSFFLIPVYIQRYNCVMEFLKKYEIQSVVDLGSAECRVINHFSQIAFMKRIALVDIDGELLRANLHRVIPRLVHRTRPCPLDVEVYEGDVTKYDHRMKAFQAVTMIELIEHLIEPDLEAVRTMVFGNLQPQLVIVTTPNADFNQLFENFQGFRHWDHKFEWSREEFQSWCKKIGEEYGYTVDFTGVGEGPEGSERLGQCSQIGIFQRTGKSQDTDVKSAEMPYSLVSKIKYPFMSEEQKRTILLNEITYFLNDYVNENKDGEVSDEVIKVPLSSLISFNGIWELCDDVATLRTYLMDGGYELADEDKQYVLYAIKKEASPTESLEDFQSSSSGGQFSDAVEDFTCLQTSSDLQKAWNYDPVEFWD